MLSTLIDYHGWANNAFFDVLESIRPELNDQQLHQTARLMHHAHIVGAIFAAHIVGKPHPYATAEPEETPNLQDLRIAADALNHWYRDYIAHARPEALSERIRFTFTDGDRASMSRAEMITHVVLHGGYHRGEVGRILRQRGIAAPWDTFAVFLHQDQPARRETVAKSA